MIKPIFQSLWIGNSLSEIERLSIKSFLAHGHEYHLYTYNTVTGIPHGAIQRDAAELIPKSSIFTTHNGSYAVFSDWFRWAMLRERGGFWVDTDVVCLRRFDFNEDLIYGKEAWDRVAIGVVGIPPGHQLAELMLDCARSPFKPQSFDSAKIRRRKLKSRILRHGYQDTKWGFVSGPTGFSRALRHLNLFELAKPYTCFYPIDASNWYAIFDETFASGLSLFQDSYAIHLWNEMMRRADGFDKNGRFPSGSLIEKLKAAYL